MPATAPAAVAAETVASAPRLEVDSPAVPATASPARVATNANPAVSEGARAISASTESTASTESPASMESSVSTESSTSTSGGSEIRPKSTKNTPTARDASGPTPRATKTTRRVVVVVACVALAALLVYAWRATQP